jgi:plasmid rolling circle replication initiator protein Rep
MNFDVPSSIFENSVTPICSDDQPFLSDYSPKDKPWDNHKLNSVYVSDALSLGYESHQKQAARMRECARILEFGWSDNYETGESVLRLKTAQFCRVRHCPICQWRRSLMWIARFYQAFPKIYADHPDWRYIMVTFTVRNCRVSELKKTIAEMNSAWQRLIQRKTWPGLGYVRSLEITRNAKNNTAHPHYHVLIAVPAGYFAGKNYLSTAKWSTLWQSALRADYTPVCDARAVKPRDYSDLKGKTIWDSPEREDFELSVDETRNAIRDSAWTDSETHVTPLQLTKFDVIFSAIREVIKYAVKPADMLSNSDWLIELSTQLRNIRSIALGGEFKNYLSDAEPTNDELVAESETENGGVFFGWRERIERYQRR